MSRAYTCDRCDDTFDGEPYATVANNEEPDSETFPDLAGIEVDDLCPGCANKLKGFMNGRDLEPAYVDPANKIQATVTIRSKKSTETGHDHIDMTGTTNY